MFKYLIIMTAMLGQVNGTAGGGGTAKVPVGNFISDQARTDIINQNTTEIKLQYSVINRQDNKIVDNGPYLTLNIRNRTNPVFKGIQLSENGQNNENFGYYFAEFMFSSYIKATKSFAQVKYEDILSSILQIIKNIATQIPNDSSIKLFFEGILAYLNGEKEDWDVTVAFKVGNFVRETLRTTYGKQITAIKTAIRNYIIHRLQRMNQPSQQSLQATPQLAAP